MTSKRRRRRGIPDETPIILPEKSDIPDRRKDVYYLVCEGHTERDYFSKIVSTYADDFRFSIVLSPGTQPEGGFDAETTVDWALRKRAELLREDPGHPDRDRVWAVFDRDDHRRVPESIRKAVSGELKVAFSKPSFDLWLLLHFASGVTPGLQVDNKWVKSVIHEQGPSSFRDFGKDNHRRSKRITDERWKDLQKAEDRRRAARFARSLVKACENVGCTPDKGHADNCDPLKRVASTEVYLIIEKLGIV